MTDSAEPNSTDSRIENAKNILAKVNVKAQPKVLIELNRLARSEDVSFDLVADLVSQDVGMSAKLLKLASSPVYSKGQKFGSVQEALMAIGFEEFKTCFMSVTLEDFLGSMGYPYKGFWDHSRRIAIYCREIAKRFAKRYVNNAYTLGLFHDVGAVLIPLYNKAYVEHIHRTLPLYFGITELEYKMVKTNHCAVGELFGQTWGLSPAILTAMRYHHKPENDTKWTKETTTLKAVLQLAELINDKIERDSDEFASFSPAKDTFAWICEYFETTPSHLSELERHLSSLEK